ncbi:hypothetical protein PAPHI01_0553 [Pancytospora philotis]|nr:hypothetical protein PAPHI01_0553 [Pancytospora philotis]
MRIYRLSVLAALAVAKPVKITGSNAFASIRRLSSLLEIPELKSIYKCLETTVHKLEDGMTAITNENKRVTSWYETIHEDYTNSQKAVSCEDFYYFFAISCARESDAYRNYLFESIEKQRCDFEEYLTYFDELFVLIKELLTPLQNYADELQIPLPGNFDKKQRTGLLKTKVSRPNKMILKYIWPYNLEIKMPCIKLCCRMSRFARFRNNNPPDVISDFFLCLKYVVSQVCDVTSNLLLITNDLQHMYVLYSTLFSYLKPTSRLIMEETVNEEYRHCPPSARMLNINIAEMYNSLRDITNLHPKYAERNLMYLSDAQKTMELLGSCGAESVNPASINNKSA